MPKLSAHILHWSHEKQLYELFTDGRLQERFEPEDEQPWLSFLEMYTSFSFQGREGRLSVIKETRPRGTAYWYAYRSSGRRTVKRYLGQASNVTIAHLEEVADALTRASDSMQTMQESKETEEQPPPPTPLLLPKLLPPRRPSSLVERPRLFRLLDAAMEGKLTLLVAPAGFGKTTVVSQWMNDRLTSGRALHLAWVSLDSGDNDLFRFWRYVIAACQTFQQNLGQAALALLSEALRPPYVSPPWETVLTLLLNDLAQQTQDGLLILDDYHTIEEPRIQETLTFFLDHLPPTLHILLMTRVEPTQLPLLRWHVGGELSELHAADLRFSSEETATLMRQVFPTPLSNAALKQLDTSLQGWVAGLRLLALTSSRHLTTPALEHALTSVNQLSDLSSPYRLLLDYIVTEILHAQPEYLQRFLLQTSMLSRLSGPLCDAVSAEENSAARLEAVEQAGLFLEALEGGWYRFHALFAGALRHEALHRLGEEELRRLSLRASHWYEQHAMTAEAIEAALLAHNFEYAARLIESIGGQISELYTVRRWIEPMPQTVLRMHPMLCWLAALALDVQQEDAPISSVGSMSVEELLSMAEEGWRNAGQLAFLGLIPAFHAMSSWRSGQFPRAVEYAQQALAQLAGDEQDSAIQVFRGICLFIVGTDYMYEGRFGEARSRLLEAHKCSLASGDRHITRSMLLLVGVCDYALGELHRAHEHYQQALSDARRQGDREITAQALLGLTNIDFAWNKLSAAESQAREALALAREEDVDLLNGAAFQLALLAYARGHITSAQQQVATLLARLQVASTPRSAHMLNDVLAWQARLFLETGELENAKRVLETLDLEAHMTARIVQARLMLSQGTFHEAWLLLERLLPVAQEQRQIHDVLEIQVLLSLVHSACQEGQQAQQWLQQALSQARVEGFVRLFLSEGEPLARLLRQLLPTLRKPELRSYAQTLLRAFAMTGGEDIPGAASSADLPFESLSAQEQRVLRLLAAGHSNPQIAHELVVSVNTVKDHVKHLYRKLGVSNRLQAVEVGHHLKLI